MSQMKLPEVWLRGPVASIPALLQPVAHALMQAREEVNEMLSHFPEERLWDTPAGVASVGFHLQHIKGFLNRLFTYAKDRALDEDQLKYLANEGDSNKSNLQLQQLVQLFNEQIELALLDLRKTDEQTLLQSRVVGRLQLPSTVIGLLFHSAEHTMRHVGQLLVTVRLLKREQE